MGPLWCVTSSCLLPRVVFCVTSLADVKWAFVPQALDGKDRMRVYRFLVLVRWREGSFEQPADIIPTICLSVPAAYFLYGSKRRSAKEELWQRDTFCLFLLH